MTTKEPTKDPLKYWHSKHGKLKILCSRDRTTRWLHYPIKPEEIQAELIRFCKSCSDPSCEHRRRKQ